MPRNTSLVSTSGPYQEYQPKIDKNPFYRTNDILNGVFKKNIKLDKGERNCTDLKTIWVNFNEVWVQPITEKLGAQDGQHYYTLRCGHPWQGKSDFEVGKYLPCFTCGTAEAYKGFEHEWEHIYFKSDLLARTVFVDQYASSLVANAPHLNVEELKGFLHLFINAFDDIRVNSLQERVYPGSAQQLWERWKRLLREGGDYNQSFLAFVMAVGLNEPVDPAGPFYNLFPIVEWGMAKARYRNFGRMLLDVRVVLDRCMGALLAHVPPPPPPQPQPPPSPPGQQANQGQSPGAQHGQSTRDGDEEDAGQQGGAQGADQSGSSSQDGSDAGERGSDVVQQQKPAGAQSDATDEDPEPPQHIPSSAQVQATDADRSQALSRLIKDAKRLDPKEEHPVLSAADVAAHPSSQSTRLLVAQVLKDDISDLDAIDAAQPASEPDADMQQAIDALRTIMPEKSGDSKLTEDARANITFIDVRPHHIDDKKYIELHEREQQSVDRIRSVFFRELGRKKASRDLSGPAVDIPAFIDYKISRRDPEVFDNQALNRGFAYHVLSDMSGSMQPIFPAVGHAMKMLHDALDFPFVDGGFWGFRGGEDIRMDPTKKNKVLGGGEVWLYRYAKNCKGFEGKAQLVMNNGAKRQVPVACGSITPMNSALRVCTRHMDRNVPAGMAKRLYLLTDGAPFQTRVDGRIISDKFLKQFVAREIRWARVHGIEVYTLIIGNSIPDEDAKLMFGDRKFWKRSSHKAGEHDSVDQVLTAMIVQNFSRYLRAR